jgi:hypothetical protein
MLTNSRHRVLIATCIACLGIAACAPRSNGITIASATTSAETAASITVTPMKTSTFSIGATNATAGIATPTAAMTTPTPAPTMNSTQAVQRIEELLDTGSGCHLSCWWGVVPGTTSWSQAQNALAPIAVHIGDFSLDSHTHVYTARLPSPVDPSDFDYLTQNYLVEDGIVERIWIRATNSGHFSIAEILNTYGLPDDVLVRTFRDQRQGFLPFYLVFWYPEHGFVAIYPSNGYFVGDGSVVEACWDAGPELTMWSPNNPLTFRDLARPDISRIPADEVDFYRPWEYATSESLDQFLAAAGSSSHKPCLQTKAELWP